MRFMVIVKASETAKPACCPRPRSRGDGQVQRGAGRRRHSAGRRRSASSAKAPGSTSTATRRPWSTGRSPRPRSSSPATGWSRPSRWRSASSGSSAARTRCRQADQHRDPAVFEAEDFGDNFTPERQAPWRSCGLGPPEQLTAGKSGFAPVSGAAAGKSHLFSDFPAKAKRPAWSEPAPRARAAWAQLLRGARG